MLCCCNRDSAIGATVLSFFILRRTNVERLAEEIALLKLLSGCLKSWASAAKAAVSRSPGSKVSRRETRFLAAADTLEKCSSGKEKSQRRMLLVVSSSESSRKGERPLQQANYINMPVDMHSLK